MKIELNLPALERLLGGDTEVELALRKQIVQEFASRHLKAIAETASYQAAMDAAKAYVNEAAKQAFDIENLAIGHLWPTVGYRLKSLVENEVQKHAQKAVDEALLKIIEYQKRYWGNEIEHAVNKVLDQQIEQQIKEGIQKRLNAAATNAE